MLAERYGGRLLNSPNDAVVKSDGTIWFTDPPYGIEDHQKEQAGNYVFRLDPGAAEPVPVCTDFLMPNGLCFGPGESLLYVADSSGERHHIRRFRVTSANELEDDGVFTVIEPHVPDGIRADAQGRLYSTAGDGVQVFRPDGKLIGKFLTPEVAANCCFGGPDGRSLFITATSSVWMVGLKSRAGRYSALRLGSLAEMAANAASHALSSKIALTGRRKPSMAAEAISPALRGRASV